MNKELVKTLQATGIAISVVVVFVSVMTIGLCWHKSYTEKLKQQAIAQKHLQQAKEAERKYETDKKIEAEKVEILERDRREEYRRKNAQEIANKIISISYDGSKHSEYERWNYEGGWKLDGAYNRVYDGGSFEICKRIIVAFNLYNKSLRKISSIDIRITALGKYNDVLLTEEKHINIAKDEGYPLDPQSNCFIVEYTKGIDWDYSNKIRNVLVVLTDAN